MTARYELLISGPVSPLVTSAFEEFEERPAPSGQSRLVGSFADEAALHGALHRLQDLRVELLEVRRLPED